MPPARRARRLVAAARLRLAAGDAPGAAEALDRALADAPGDAEAAYWRGVASRERPDEALGFARAAARDRDPARRAAALRLGAEIRMDLGDAAGARRDAEAATAADPRSLDAWALLARAAKGDAKAAARAAARAEALAVEAPDWLRPAALRTCARVRRDLGDDARAAADLGAALTSDPDDLDALEALVDLRRSSAAPAAVAGTAPPTAAPAAPDTAAAALEFERSVEDMPGWRRGPALLWVAGRWADLGDARSAGRAFLRAQAYDWRSLRYADMAVRLGRTRRGPRLEALYRAAAEAHKTLGDPAGARRVLERATAAAPDSPEPWGELARLDLDAGRLDEARADSDRQLALLDAAGAPAPERATARRQRAFILRARGDDAGAREEFRRALELDPSDGLSRRELAGPPPPAPPPSRADLDAAFAKDPATLCRSDALRAAAPVDALPVYDRCLATAPDDAVLLADRGVARASAGDLDGALADLRRSAALGPGRASTRLSLEAVLARYKEKPSLP